MKVRIILMILLICTSILSGCTSQSPNDADVTTDISKYPPISDSEVTETIEISEPETTEGIYTDDPITDSTITETKSESETFAPETQEPALRMIVNDVPVDVVWEDNETVAEIFSYAQGNLITVNTTVYGGFEQVGSLPQSFSRNDTQMTTQPGDIVLYSGNQLVVFFGSNSWSYTKLGHINLSADELNELLSADTAIIEINVD